MMIRDRRKWDVDFPAELRKFVRTDVPFDVVTFWLLYMSRLNNGILLSKTCYSPDLLLGLCAVLEKWI